MNRASIALLVGISGLASAAPGDVTFHGTLVSPPECTINTVEVVFNDIVIGKIDGSEYIKDVPYTITCSPDQSYDLLAMSLTFSGTQTSYDDAAIETDVSGLGIELQQNGTPFVVGSTININKNSPPALKAVPVKASDANLMEGQFEAWASLQVDYQ